MNLVSIFTIVLLITASALCIALIIYMKQITDSFKSVQLSLNKISNDVEPLIDSATELSEKINSFTDEAKEQLSISKNIITDVKDRVDTVLDLEKKIRGGLEDSSMELIKNLSAVSNGISAFWSAYKKK